MVIDADLREILYEDTKSESDHNDCRMSNFQNLRFRICTRERYGRSCYNPLLGAAAYSLELSGRHTCFRTFFTARCTLVQSAVLRSHVVCLSVCNVGEL